MSNTNNEAPEGRSVMDKPFVVTVCRMTASYETREILADDLDDACWQAVNYPHAGNHVWSWDDDSPTVEFVTHAGEGHAADFMDEDGEFDQNVFQDDGDCQDVPKRWSEVGMCKDPDAVRLRQALKNLLEVYEPDARDDPVGAAHVDAADALVQETAYLEGK